jgi:hypothetical protein
MSRASSPAHVWLSGRAAVDRLGALARSALTAGVSRSGLVVRLGLLPRAFLRPHHRRAIRERLDPLLELDRALGFELPEGTLLVLWRQPGREAAEAPLAEVKALLAGFPGAPAELEPIAYPLALPDMAAHLLALLNMAEMSESEGRVPGRDAPPAPPVEPDRVGEIETILARADLLPYLRTRPVIRLNERGQALTEWEERELDWEALAALLVPGRSLTADPAIRRRLAATAERRLLGLLGEPGLIRRGQALSLTLTLETVFSPEFLAFDRSLPAGSRPGVLLAFSPAEILEDQALLRFARAFLKMRGYRLILRGLPLAWLSAFPLERLGFDFLRLDYEERYGASSLPPGLDPARLVLSRVDTPEALLFGRRSGIELYSGLLAKPARFSFLETVWGAPLSETAPS